MVCAGSGAYVGIIDMRDLEFMELPERIYAMTEEDAMCSEGQPIGAAASSPRLAPVARFQDEACVFDAQD